MEKGENRHEENRVKFNVDRSLYSRDVLIKAAYSFIDDYYIHLSSDEKSYHVEIGRKDGKASIGVAAQFENELLSQAARYIIYKNTKQLRELLVARAMASTLITSDKIYDAVEESTDDDEKELDHILKNWFETEK